MQKIIDAEKSDLFDVLAYVAYALPAAHPRGTGRNGPRSSSATHFNSKQQAFLDFVLSHYVSVGVEELDQEKLTPLLRLQVPRLHRRRRRRSGQAGGDWAGVRRLPEVSVREAGGGIAIGYRGDIAPLQSGWVATH